MRRVVTAVLWLAMALAVGCARTEEPQETNLQTWTGPDQRVYSMDSSHCGKSATAKRLGLPGYIVIRERATHNGPFKSTDTIVSRTIEMRDSGYSLGDSKLLFHPPDSKHVFIQRAGNEDVLQYVLLPCK